MNAFLLAATSDFHPEDEFALHPWITIEIGPIDLSVNKAVAYIWLGGLVTILFGIWVMRFGRSLRPGRRQTVGEGLYDALQGQIAEGNLPKKAASIWFPYCAALFLFIWILNLIGFIPLPLSDEKFTLFGLELPTFGIYAATANLERHPRARARSPSSPRTSRASATTARGSTSAAGSPRGRRSRCSR